MTLAAHRFLWGYGPSGFSIVDRQGEGHAFEAPCLDEIGRWKLAFDRVAQIVTPVRAGGRLIAMLAFRSRVSERAAGDRFRETACAVIAWEHAAKHAVHNQLLELVPAFQQAGAFPVEEATSPVCGSRAVPCAHEPAWCARAWAQLLNEDRVLLISEAEGSLADCLRLISLLPPAIACRTAVGEGLLPGAQPPCHGLFIAHPSGAVPDRAAATASGPPNSGASASPLEGLAEAWVRREILLHAHDVDRVASELWARCANEAECDIAQLDRERLLRSMLSDAAHDWLLSGSENSPTDSLAHWLNMGLAEGVSPDPVRLANLLCAMPSRSRSNAVRRLLQLADKLVARDARHATVVVGAAIEDALQRELMRESDIVLFDRQTWIGGVLSGSRHKPDHACVAHIAWSLVGELLALWSSQTPDVLARALARPAHGTADGYDGFVRRFAQRFARPQTVEDALHKLANRRKESAVRVPERLLPLTLRTPEGRTSLRPKPTVLEAMLVAAVLTAARVGRKQAGAPTAVAPLLSQRRQSHA